MDPRNATMYFLNMDLICQKRLWRSVPHWLPWLTYGGRHCRLGALRKIGKLEAYQTHFRCQQPIRTQ